MPIYGWSVTLHQEQEYFTTFTSKLASLMAQDMQLVLYQEAMEFCNLISSFRGRSMI